MLIGKKINLRPTTSADFPALIEIFNDAKTMASLLSYFQFSFWTDEIIKSKFEKTFAEQKQGEAAPFVVMDCESGKLVGNCTLRNINMQSGEADFGIILHHSVWGNGVAAETHSLCLSYGFEKLSLKKIKFQTDVKNLRMRKFFEKAGVVLEKIDENGYCHYYVTQNEWPTVARKLNDVIAAHSEG